MSLRCLLYLLQSRQYSINLIHAAYPSNETNKIYILCYEASIQETLKILHNLSSALMVYLSDENISKIMVSHNGKPPYIKVYPIKTKQHQSYARSLINLAPIDNPQDDQDEDEEVQVMEESYAFSLPPNNPKNHLSHQNVSQSLPPSAKRSRQGQVISSYMPHKTTSTLPPDFETTTNHDKLKATVNENIARMKNLEQSSPQNSPPMELI